MYVDEPEPECCMCGAVDSEVYYYGFVKGRRCRQCGHEQILEDGSKKQTVPGSWTSTHTRPSF